MWLSAVSALLLLQPASASKLELTNIRATYGALGAVRPGFAILPGELLYIAFDIVGLQADMQGRLRYGTALEVEESKGKIIFRDDFSETPTILVNLLGGSRVPHSVVINTGLDQSPGTYRAKVTVRDHQAKKDLSFTKEFTVNPPEFGIVRVQLFFDPLSQVPAPPVGAVGQKFYFNFVPVHYKRDMKQEGAIAVELNVLDEKGNPTPVQPLSGVHSRLPPEINYLQLRFDVPLQRPGQFKLVLKATDQVAKKTVSLTIPIQVLEVK